MQRVLTNPRPAWQRAVEKVGLSFHTLDDGKPYWEERAYYQFSADEIDTLEAATEELTARCREAAQWVIEHGAFELFGLTQPWIDLIRASWERREPALLGRFDFSWGGEASGVAPKLLEFNADTPTALLEAAVAQWYWLQDRFPGEDQFNSLHERLVARWRELDLAGRGPVHFTCLRGSAEDEMTVTYLRDTALQAGLEGEFLFIEDIGAREATAEFFDASNRPIRTLCKLYPWEWLVRDRYGALLPRTALRLIEPIWKMLWSNKAILGVLWHLFPEHPNLLPAAFEPEKLPAASTQAGVVRKPLLGREGANIEITQPGRSVALASRGGPYAEAAARYVYQAFQPLPDFDWRRPVIGSWIIGEHAAGIGIREGDGPITDNRSRFVPHVFTPRG
ncbi:MAG: glutathionylspermidine synthase family protein [Verrucomicrobia bacterium]|nr:glutathionylspermidine synthase family protein [Verrucomicrobiota bacterium]